MITNKKVLVLSPHIDDAEFGCGGTISQLLRNGCEIYYLAFSDCRESILDQFSPDVLHSELAESMKILNIKKFKVLDFKVRRFHEERQRLLQCLVDIKDSWNPDVVLTPSTYDFHQDHEVVTNECIRAFKHCTLLGYELPWNCLSFSTGAIVPLEEIDLKNKINSIECYKSQSHRIYSNADYITSLAMTRGVMINQKIAEVFENIRIIIN